MTKKRSAGILIENDKVLMIHRIKDKNEFWVFPGGGIEEGESPETALVREMLEETSLCIKVDQIAIEIETNFNNKTNTETYYFITRISGEPKLQDDSPEVLRMLNTNSENFYELVWIPITDFNNYIIYPIQVKNFLCHNIKQFNKL